MIFNTIETIYNSDPTAVVEVPSKKLVLYGAGNKAREILSVLRENGRCVEACIDLRAPRTFEGLPVYRPDDPILKQFAADRYTVIIGIFNPTVDIFDIKTTLQQIGFYNVIGPVELRQVFPLGETYWLSDSATMIPSASTTMWLNQRLRDAESQRILVETLLLRKMHDPCFLRQVNPLDQYMPIGVPTPRQGLRFVCGGAFDGDTLLSLRAAGCSFEAVAAFEPDSANFERLTGRLKITHVADTLLLEQSGLGQCSKQVRFRSQREGSSAVTEDGDSVINIVSFDEKFPDFFPSYIKLDIEGAESDALLGMTRTIDMSRPALAVCVYHKPSDLWEIPLLVDKLLPDSDFYLRAHAWSGFDLVLYAIPR